MPNSVCLEETETNKIQFLLIPCLFCKKKFIYECTFLKHLSIVHDQSTSHRRSCTSEDVLQKISAGIVLINNSKISAEALFMFMRSYGVKLKDVESMTKIIIDYYSSIQFYIINNNSNTNVCNNNKNKNNNNSHNNSQVLKRYKNINNVIDFIDGEGCLFKKILSGDNKQIIDCAKQYVTKHFSKKIGKKAIAGKIKNTREVLHSSAINYYIKFKMEVDKECMGDENVFDVLPPDNIFGTQPYRLQPITFNVLQDLLGNSIDRIDFTFDKLMIFNNWEINDWPSSVINAMTEKINLSKQKIIIDYIHEFKQSVAQFFDFNDNYKFINQAKYINLNQLQFLDQRFKEFIKNLNQWWNHPYKIYHTNAIYRNMEDNEYVTLKLNQNNAIKFILPSNLENFNLIVILACLRMYYQDTFRSNNDVLCNLYGHVKVIMAILKYEFINKKKLKLTLEKLITSNFIYTHIALKTKKVYWPNLEKIIEETEKFKTNKTIKTILNITPLTYTTSAVFHKIPTTLYIKQSFNHQETNKFVIDNFFHKISFINHFLQSILKFTTNYNLKSKEYYKLLEELAETVTKKKENSSSLLEVDEIMELIHTKSENTLNQLQHVIQPSTTSSSTYYRQPTELDRFMDENYRNAPIPQQ